MTHKKEIKFNSQEVELISETHKQLIITILKQLNHIKCDEKKFHLCTFAMAITVANMIDAFGINGSQGINSYINDFCDLTKKLHSEVKQMGHTGYLQVKGNKITEGKLN